MALVAYDDNSDSSDYEDGDSENATAILLNYKINETIKQPSSTHSDIQTAHETEDIATAKTLFNLLPEPSKNKPAVFEDDDEFLHKKETISNPIKPKAKITVPSLNDFKDVEDSIPNAKPKMVNGKKSGLLSILPQPRNTVRATTTSKTLMPDILRQKANNATIQKLNSINKKKETIAPPVKKSMDTLQLNNSDDSDDDGDEVHNDFFSINKPVELPVENLLLDTSTEQSANIKVVSGPAATQDKPGINSYFNTDTTKSHIELQQDYEESNNTHYYDNSGGSSSNNELDNEIKNNVDDVPLDEEAIMKLVGARGKRKREDIQIVDVNQQEVLADAREWLLKGLMDDTSKRVSCSKRKGHEPTSQQKRKHQITYLAHQAKANEIELQNQWASNRMTKRKTQSKYGF